MGDREVTFYVCGHQDDWQLFMGTRARNDVCRASPKARVVFVFLTNGRPRIDQPPYTDDKFWQAREMGAVASAMWLRGLIPNPQNPPSITFDTAVRTKSVVADAVVVNGVGNIVQRYIVQDDDTRCYFFRMPEGLVTGTWGTASGGGVLGPTGQSLQPDCDWPAYADTDALEAALTWVYQEETTVESRGYSWVNYLDESPEVVGDQPDYSKSHPDHRAASVWAKLAAEAGGAMHHQTFIGYLTADWPQNAANGPGVALFQAYLHVAKRFNPAYAAGGDVYDAWAKRQYTTEQARAAGLI